MKTCECANCGAIIVGRPGYLGLCVSRGDDQREADEREVDDREPPMTPPNPQDTAGGSTP